MITVTKNNIVFEEKKKIVRQNKSHLKFIKYFLVLF